MRRKPAKQVKKRAKKPSVAKRKRGQRPVPTAGAVPPDMSWLPDPKVALERLALPRGRPLVLTSDIQDQVVRVLNHSGTIDDAAYVVGITRKTLCIWRQKGREEPEANGGIYRRFCDAVDAAIVTRRFAREAVILKAGLTDWRAEAWALERAEPLRYAPRVRVHVENELTNVIARIEAEFSSDPETCDRVLAAIGGGDGLASTGPEETGEGGREDEPGEGGGTVLPTQPIPQADDVPPARR